MISVADQLISRVLYESVELRQNGPSAHGGAVHYDVHHDGRYVGNIAVRPVDRAPGLPDGARGGKLGIRIEPEYRGNTKLVMAAMREIRRRHPDLTHVGGFRLTGTRSDAVGRDAYTWVPLGEEFEYRGQHQPFMGPPIHNLLDKNADGSGPMAPTDIYTHTHYYQTGDDASDAESMAAIHDARHDRKLTRRPAKDNSALRSLMPDAEPHLFQDRPEESDESLAARQARRARGEHKVWIYRAAPRGAHMLNGGDWVTPSTTYARGHSKHPTDRSQDMPVFKARVLAKHVRWAGDSINEFGYNGPPIKMTLHKRGGRNAPKVG